MDLKDYRNLFIVCNLVLSFFVISPAFNLFISFNVEEPFSELSILGPGQMAKDYPFNVLVNSEESLYVTVSNHMGGSTYYMVYVKFRNQTQPFPNSTTSSSLAPFYEFRVFLLDGEKWEGLVRFKFLEVLSDADTIQVKKMLVNNVVFEMNSTSKWDYQYNGFYFQLFFELWLYDMSTKCFKYHERAVGVWLNMTI